MKILNKDLRTIGTCKDCKHWNKYTIMWSSDNLEHRSCDKIDKYVSPVNQRYGSVPREDFGCIHWEGKEID